MESGSNTQGGRVTPVATLGGARLPADLGLSSLGLLMQLVGSLSLGLMAYIALMPVFAGATGGSGTWFVFLLGASGAVRAAFHRAAGTSLIYGGVPRAQKAIQTYIGVAALETVVWVFVMVKMGSSIKELIPMAAMLLSWPVALAVIINRPKYKAVLEQDEVVQGEDLGFEGSGVFMLILGVMGTLFSGLMLMTLFKLPSQALSSPEGLLLLGIFMMLIARSAVHAHAGFKATSGVDTDSAGEAAARYYSFGVVSSVIAAGGLLVMMMMSTLHPASILTVGIIMSLLLLWPLLLRRFYTEKNFSVLLAGSEGPVQRRAPDAGMTALGWILLGMGVFSLSLSVPELILGVEGNPMASIFGGSAFGGGPDQSAWWGIGTAAVQLWAGIELTQMSDRWKLAANVYGVVATAVTLYLVWPMFGELKNSLGFMGGGMGGIFKLILQGTIAINLVIPVVTVVLANRKITPTATARIRADA